MMIQTTIATIAVTIRSRRRQKPTASASSHIEEIANT